METYWLNGKTVAVPSSSEKDVEENEAAKPE